VPNGSKKLHGADKEKTYGELFSDFKGYDVQAAGRNAKEKDMKEERQKRNRITVQPAG